MRQRCFYNTLFAAGKHGMLTSNFRRTFWPDQIGGETYGSFMDVVGDDKWRTLMYTFRTSTILPLEMLERLSRDWPLAHFVLVHETLVEHGVASIGYAVVEGGRRRHYWGSTLPAGRAAKNLPRNNPLVRYERYRLSWDDFEARLRGEGIEPDDPVVNGPVGDEDDIDW